MKPTLILTILLFTSVSSKLFACSCIGEYTIKEAVKQADAVFVGIVLSKNYVSLKDSTMIKMFPNDTTIRNSPMSNMTIARYDFLVENIYKGKITKDTIAIYTGLGGGDCGIRFKEGERFIVYGEKETYFGQLNNDFPYPKGKNIFWTYTCLRTTSYFQEEINTIEKVAKKNKRKTGTK